MNCGIGKCFNLKPFAVRQWIVLVNNGTVLVDLGSADGVKWPEISEDLFELIKFELRFTSQLFYVKWDVDPFDVMLFMQEDCFERTSDRMTPNLEKLSSICRESKYYRWVWSRQMKTIRHLLWSGYVYLPKTLRKGFKDGCSKSNPQIHYTSAGQDGSEFSPLFFEMIVFPIPPKRVQEAYKFWVLVEK